MGRDIPAHGWRFLSGNQENIDKICDSVGFRYTKQDNVFIHAAVITVLSAQGKIVRYLYTGDVVRNVLPIFPFEIELALSEAGNGKVGGAVHRIVRLCFQYDQEGKRYSLSITRIMLVIILLFAGCILLYVTVFCKIGRKAEQEGDGRHDL